MSDGFWVSSVLVTASDSVSAAGDRRSPTLSGLSSLRKAVVRRHQLMQRCRSTAGMTRSALPIGEGTNSTAPLRLRMHGAQAPPAGIVLPRPVGMILTYPREPRQTELVPGCISLARVAPTRAPRGRQRSARTTGRRRASLHHPCAQAYDTGAKSLAVRRAGLIAAPVL